MKPYFRACAFALLMPLLWTASAQEAKPDPAPEKERELQVVELTGDVIKFLSPSDHDELIGSLIGTQQIVFDNGTGTIYFDKQGDDSRVVLVSRKRIAPNRPDMYLSTGVADWNRILTRNNLFTDRDFSMYNNRTRLVAKSAELLELESKVHMLSATVRSAEGRELEKLEDELKTLLDEIFDLKQKERTAEIESLQVRIDESVQERDVRESNRDAIIQQRLDQLMGRTSKYEW